MRIITKKLLRSNKCVNLYGINIDDRQKEREREREEKKMMMSSLLSELKRHSGCKCV